MARLTATTFSTPEEAQAHCPKGYYVEWLYDSYSILPYVSPSFFAAKASTKKADDPDVVRPGL